MDRQAQREALAKQFPKIIGLSSSGAWMWSNKPGTWYCCYPENDPLSDLNVMHEIEKKLWNSEDESLDGIVGTYEDFLMNIVVRDWNLDHDAHRWISCANAEQKAEAILRIFNLWFS
jgi:hypothetical protein